MNFIDFQTLTGKENMQIDSDLLDLAIKEKQKDFTLRFYGWKPACVSLGRNQSDEFVDYNLLKELNIDCVRRLTGGRALLHDMELTYSYICPIDFLKNGDSVVQSYKEISQFLINGFKNLGIDLEFGSGRPHSRNSSGPIDYCMLVSTGADLCWNGRKFVGSAQFRKEGYILQHGSILLDYDKKLLEKLFKEKVKSIVSLKEINPNLNIYDVIKALKIK